MYIWSYESYSFIHPVSIRIEVYFDENGYVQNLKIDVNIISNVRKRRKNWDPKFRLPVSTKTKTKIESCNLYLVQLIAHKRSFKVLHRDSMKPKRRQKINSVELLKI